MVNAFLTLLSYDRSLRSRYGKSHLAAFACLALALVFHFGCARPQEGFPAPKLDAKRLGLAAIAEYDTNKNGKIDGSEFDKCPGLKAAHARLEKLGHGYVTADAIARRIEQWDESHKDRLRIICIVTRNGKPLPEAQVTFVPETFFGSRTISIASGETDENGEAVMNLVWRDLTGYGGGNAGFYRGGITTSDSVIPAKYNTDTILGVEIANDSDGIRKVDRGGKTRFTVAFDLVWE
jgi:hypothetical protein